MRFLKSFGIALLILLAIGVWMGTGVIVQGGKGPGNGERPVVSLFTGDEPSADESIAHTEQDGVDPRLTIAERTDAELGVNGETPSVRIKTFTVKSMPLEVTLRGQTKARATITASSETSGTVDEVAVEKGDSVKTGALLCKLDQGTRQAALAQAQAALDKAQLDYDTNEKLREKGVASANSKAQLEVALRSAQAALDQAQAELDRTEIHAKVDGIVQAPVAEVGSLLNAGQPCATIVQLDPIVFEGSIPESKIGLARTGLPVSVTTIDGHKGKGKVTYISATADAATRTFKAEAEIPNPDGDIRAGLTADATIKMGIIPAHLIPQSVLTLDDDGTLGVRAVKDDKVVFHSVDIVKDTRDGVWVTGLPGTIDIITLGQENVKPGQTVKAETYSPDNTASGDAAS